VDINLLEEFVVMETMMNIPTMTFAKLVEQLLQDARPAK
jgi:hypothetical protein